MINFYTDICPYCVKLDEETFADEKASAFLNGNFVNVKSNAGKTSLHVNYGLAGVPTTIFAASDGTEMGRIMGYRPPDQFQEGAQEALDYWNDNYTE